MRDDDAIGDLFSRVDPARTPTGAPLTAAQIAVRDRITSDKARPRRHGMRAWGWTGAIALPVAATLITVALVTGKSPCPS